MTCGATDFTIKVWDYAECTLLLSKHYPREVRSVSIHPTGLFSIAAFSDYVEYQMIESDDLVPLKYYTISGCTECAFSRSGHMFALAKLDAIDVYCSVLFEKRFSCLGNPQAFVSTRRAEARANYTRTLSSSSYSPPHPKGKNGTSRPVLVEVIIRGRLRLGETIKNSLVVRNSFSYELR